MESEKQRLINTLDSLDPESRRTLLASLEELKRLGNEDPAKAEKIIVKLLEL